MKQLWNVTTAAVLLLLLSSCGFNLGLNKPQIDLGIDPLPLGFNYTIDQQTGIVDIRISSHTLFVRQPCRFNRSDGRRLYHRVLRLER